MNPSQFTCERCDRQASTVKTVVWCDYHSWCDYTTKPKPSWYIDHCFHECRPIPKGEVGCEECVAYDDKMKKIQEEESKQNGIF